MVLIPAGSVVIGQPSRTTDAWGTPRHPNATPRATVPAFALDRNAVTVRDYAATAARDPSLTIDRTQCQRSAPGPDEPVVCVTWWQADTFCRARGGRLPTLAEWERAADVPSSGVSIARPDFEWVDDRSPAAVLDRGPARPCPDETNTEHPRCHHTRKTRLNGPAHPRFYWNIHHAERRIHLLGFRCVIPLPDAPQ